jgi:2-polyprenyl-3-methyl-5-hydroxy-6-metoxy-1,4-benzoquinol methylase
MTEHDTSTSTDGASGRAPDPDALKMYSFQVFTKLEGAVTAGMIHLGDKLGLFRALADADGPVTSEELAGLTGLAERWVREWAHNQAAARIIDAHTGDAPDDTAVRFSLSPEAVAVLASPEHPAFGMGMFHRLPQTMRTLEEMPESFVTGLGHDYDSHGPEGAVGIERSFEPWSNAFLVPEVLPALDGVVDKLRAGGVVADVGCGAGSAVLKMAEAFPASRFHGYDISRYALGRAEQKRVEAGATNVHFHDPRQDPLPSNHTVDLVTTFDCIHDMTDPQGMMHAIRSAIAPDGVWLLVDIKARDTFAENVEKNPMASLMYGISVLSCMSSALSEPGGAGLGTLGLPASKAEEMALAAGFTRFRKLDIDHAVNAFYEIRP